MRLDTVFSCWQDHDKNLADDPSQRLTAEEKKEAVAQFVLEQTSQQRAGAGGTVTRSQSKRLSKVGPCEGWHA